MNNTNIFSEVSNVINRLQRAFRQSLSNSIYIQSLKICRAASSSAAEEALYMRFLEIWQNRAREEADTHHYGNIIYCQFSAVVSEVLMHIYI